MMLSSLAPIVSMGCVYCKPSAIEESMESPRARPLAAHLCVGAGAGGGADRDAIISGVNGGHDCDSVLFEMRGGGGCWGDGDDSCGPCREAAHEWFV